MINAIRYGLTAPNAKGQFGKVVAEKIRTDQAKKIYDVVLNPEETIPQIGALSAENWAYKSLGVSVNYDDIKSTAKRKVVVFVFDTAGELTHPDLQAGLSKEKFSAFSQRAETEGHGWHVAGSYVATKEGLEVGLCKPLVELKLIELIPVKVLDGGNGTKFTIDSGVKWANTKATEFIKKGYFVIYNFSLGGGTSTWESTDKLLKEAYEMGVLTVAAAGNTGKSGVNYPGCSQYTLGVGSLTKKGNALTKSSFSTYGAQVYVASPGESIYSTWYDEGYETISGTSMATPNFGAVCAIVASCRPKITNKELIQLLASKSVDLGAKGRDEYYGHGLPLLTELLEKTVQVFEGAVISSEVMFNGVNIFIQATGDITNLYAKSDDPAKECYEDVAGSFKLLKLAKGKSFYEAALQLKEQISSINNTFKLKSVTCRYKNETYTLTHE